MKPSPCLKCPKKGCGAYHSKCEEYLDFVKENEEKRHKKKLEKEITEYKRYCI